MGMSETPEGLQKQISKALLREYTRKWSMTANVKKCAVLVCSEDNEVNTVSFKSKWGEDELPIVDQYNTCYLGVEISKDCSWDAHI